MIKFKSITAKNFKSFKNLEIVFSDFTVIVGANASGKSNFVRLFKFIKDIILFGIDDAISLQGGIKYLKNLQASKEETVFLDFQLEVNEPWVRPLKMLKNGSGAVPNATIKKIDYSFEIQPAKRGQGYKIVSDKLSILYDILVIDDKIDNAKDDSVEVVDSVQLCFYKEKTSYKYKCHSNFDNSKFHDVIDEIAKSLGADFFCLYMHDSTKELMLRHFSILMPPYFYEESLINIFDFDPKRLKRACSITALTHLQEDGGNLASVIQNILRTQESRHRFTILLQDILPFIKGVAVQKSIDQSISYQVTENYSNSSIYSNFLSDGTVSIIAFIVALYFEKQARTLIFEEPERNVHPKLLSNLISMANDVAKEKQIIFTTHNAEILKNVRIDDIRLIKRDNNGFSCILTPNENETVLNFINNEIGIDELFIDDLLG